MSIFDSHCHIQETEFESLDGVEVSKLAVMGTMPKDWEKVATLFKKFPSRIIPCFGVHPWFAESLKKDHSAIESNQVKRPLPENSEIWWLSLLKDYLLRFPKAIVGEIGIDKCAVDPITKEVYDFDIQKQALFSQFQMAADLHRSVSVHCVQAFGSLVDLFKEIKNDLLLPKDNEKKIGLRFPHKIMLHSFSGSVETAKALKAAVSFSKKETKFLNENISEDLTKESGFECAGSIGAIFIPPLLFFSVSELVNLRSEKKLKQLLPSIPIDRILIESDCGSVSIVDKKLETISLRCASILNMSTASFLEQVSRNSQQFFYS